MPTRTQIDRVTVHDSRFLVSAIPDGSISLNSLIVLETVTASRPILEELAKRFNSHAALVEACKKALTCASLDHAVRQVITAALAAVKGEHP
jgi:hypothetical protein